MCIRDRLVGTGRPDEDPLETSPGYAIQYHLVNPQRQGPLRVWLLAPDEAMEVAREFKKRFEGPQATVEIRRLLNAFDVESTYRKVREVYETELGTAELAPADVIADFTAGTKLMSAGMLLACSLAGWPLQYMTGRKEGIVPTPMEIKFRP